MLVAPKLGAAGVPPSWKDGGALLAGVAAGAVEPGGGAPKGNPAEVVGVDPNEDKPPVEAPKAGGAVVVGALNPSPKPAGAVEAAG